MKYTCTTTCTVQQALVLPYLRREYYVRKYGSKLLSYIIYIVCLFSVQSSQDSSTSIRVQRFFIEQDTLKYNGLYQLLPEVHVLSYFRTFEGTSGVHIYITATYIRRYQVYLYVLYIRKYGSTKVLPEESTSFSVLRTQLRTQLRTEQKVISKVTRVVHYCTFV